MPETIVLNDKTKAFCEKVAELSGEIITLCEQCGTCSGGCPVVKDMDITPSEMMRKVMLGQEDVLDSKTMWLCASCNTCTVRCPRGLDVAKVAEALRQIKLRDSIDKVDLNKIPAEELSKFPPIVIIATNRKLIS